MGFFAAYIYFALQRRPQPDCKFSGSMGTDALHHLKMDDILTVSPVKFSRVEYLFRFLKGVEI